MTLQTCLTVVIFGFCIHKSLECPQTNTSCNDIYTAERFTFFHRCPKGSEIYVFDNRTVVAHVLGNSKSKYLDEVISIGNDSVVTRNCRDLLVKCTVPLGDGGVEDLCWDYKVTVMPNPDSFQSPTPQNLTIGWAVVGGLVGAGGLILLIGMLYYMRKRKHHVASTVSLVLQYLRCSCLRNEISKAEVVADDFDTTQPNGVIRLSEISATDPRGSSGSAVEQDNTLESVHVHSIDPTADGQAPQSFSLDRNSSKQGIQPTESGDVVVSECNGASTHRAMNRSLRDDPGGGNDNNGKAIVGIAEMHSGWTGGDRGPEDHGNEGQPLLSNQRAANQGFDMTGKAVALVYKHGFDPDQVSRCSTVPDTDVESTPNMNSFSIDEY